MGPEKSDNPRIQREDLQERVDLRQMLAKHGVRPNKRFGQHFLISEGVIRKIVLASEEALGILEVGPGPGVLSRPLSDFATITCVEIDSGIIPVLRDFAPLARVVQNDALEADLEAFLDELPEPRVLVSNMPYNITGPLLDRFCRVRHLFSHAVLMMQREVAEKILAQPGDSKRGALSVVMQTQFSISRVCNVPPGCFLPPPKVDSTVLKLVPSAEPFEDTYFELVRKCFAQPRKTLFNNLSAAIGKEEAVNLLDQIELSGSLRPHQLTWQQWQSLLS